MVWLGYRWRPSLARQPFVHRITVDIRGSESVGVGLSSTATLSHFDSLGPLKRTPVTAVSATDVIIPAAIWRLSGSEDFRA